MLETDGTVLKTLVVTDLIASTQLTEQLGDERTSEIFGRQDRLARDWLERTGGIEIDKTDGFLMFFNRPIEAIEFAIGYHEALADLSREIGVTIETRVGIHLGEVVVRRNSREDIARGANEYEVEGLAKPMAARLMSLALGRQTILSRSAFDVARRAAVGREWKGRNVQWLAHGRYVLKGVEEPMEIFEAGVEGFAPLTPPPDSEKVKRVGESGKVLGWHPAPGLEIPQRSRWVVEKKLGEGGFGEVWLAQHNKTGERRVFKFCYETEKLRALQREVTLFRLLKEDLGDRPDINRILDWNFEKPPFFIEAEYSESGSLKEWSERQGGLESVPLATRLEIVAQTAEALAAANSVGVLHKDIKPENILVHEDEKGEPRICITDFGIGMVTSQSRLAEANITVLGMTLDAGSEDTTGSGTRLYMAPEVLEGRVPTVQADIYALGVVLYQMVVGSFSVALAPGWERDVPDELLKEDIALAVDRSPQRRLGNALRIAERLRSLDERRKKREEERIAQEREERSRRRRKIAWFVAASSSALLIVMAAFSVMVYREQQRAEKNLRLAKAAVDQMLTEVGDEALADVPQMEEVRKVLLGKARNFYLEFQEQRPSDPDLRMDPALSLRRLAQIYSLEGEIEAASEEYQKAIELLSALAEDYPDNPEYRRELANTHNWRGELLRDHPSYFEEARASYESALALQEELSEQFSDRLDYQHELARTYNSRGILLENSDQYLAEESYRKALGILKSVTKEGQAAEHPEYLLDLSRTYNNLGTLYASQNRNEEARPFLEKTVQTMESLARSQPDKRQFKQALALRYTNLAYLLHRQEEAALADDVNRKALDLFAELARPVPDLMGEQARAFWVQGTILREQGRHKEAEQAFQQSLRISGELKQGPSDYATGRTFRIRFAWIRWRESPVQVAELNDLPLSDQQKICDDYAWLVRELSPEDLREIVGSGHGDHVAGVLSNCSRSGHKTDRKDDDYYQDSVTILNRKLVSSDNVGL